MNARRLIGSGVIAGFGFGQLTAWTMLRGECPGAPGLIALSSFGVGMSAFGLLMMFYIYSGTRSST
jgi:hypothetical protein